MSRKLRIALLASNPKLYSNKRIMQAAEDRGHSIEFIRIKHCYMDITAENPEIYYRGGHSISDFDAVIPRIKPAVTFYGCALLRQFELNNIYSLNSPVAISRSRDKLRTLQMMSYKGISIPRTGFADSPHDTKALIKMVGGAPLIVKLLEGTQGKGVVLAETDKAAESVINAFKTLKAQILVQQFIKESKGTDIRCFVIGDQVVAAMQRTAPAGEFRANVHLGAKVEAIEITPEERKTAIDATKVVGLKVAGVDILRSDTGPKVIEINSSPGLEGIELATQLDIGGLMIEYIEQNIPDKKRDGKIISMD